ncbi:hypothetical protein Hte_007533 [Hypoxylon texense]
MRSTTLSFTFLSLLHLSVGQHKIPEVVVYVDQYNNPVRTATETVVYVPITAETSEVVAPKTSTVHLTPVSSQVGEPTSQVSPQPVTPTPQDNPPISSVQSDPTISTLPKPPTSSPSTPNSGTSLYGVTYSPYKGSGGCKTADEVDADFAAVAPDYGVIRLYGVDCDQVATSYAAAKRHGNKLFLGIFDINSIEQSVFTIAAGVQHDWSIVDTVSVGNELVNSGGATVSQALGALSQARAALRSAGYDGPVVVVDTFVTMMANPELCDQSDYCAINIHPFFDPNTGPRQAGWFVTSTVKRVRSKLSDPDQRIVVTETGWPWQGESNGAAIPGMNQQSVAISSIESAFTNNPSDVILFTAFNDMWKKPAAGTFMAEQFWGMGGRYSSSDE